MLRPMFGHRPKFKRFEYNPRFYDPSKEESRKRRIRFDSKRRRDRQPLRVLMYAAGLAFVVWVIASI